MNEKTLKILEFDKIRELKNKIHIKKEINLPTNDENYNKYFTKYE